MNMSGIRRLISYRMICIICALLLCFPIAACGETDSSVTLHVAMPYSENVLEPSDNYYVEWLEQKTGLNIEPVIIRQRKSTEYLDALFASDTDIDIVMFGAGFDITEDELKPYAAAGDIIPRDDGSLSYPNFGSKPVGDCGQILWINSQWLDRLGLKVPETTDGLETVLKNFRDSDPNGNGIRDEIPLLSCSESPAYDAGQLMIQSYIYNDPYNNRIFTDADGSVIDASKTPEYKEGVAFCDGLKSQELLEYVDEGYSLSEYTELINSPEDLVGAFTADSLSHVIYQGNPEIMARFMHVAPLSGPAGVRNALFTEQTAEIGAIICAGSEHKTEAERLLDMMLTPEASLIARYGEEGVDWDYSEGTDVSIYGTQSTIVTHNYIWNTPQNKHLSGIGPMNVPMEYLKGVTWNGINSDFEYTDARAQMSYAPFLPATEGGLDKKE